MSILCYVVNSGSRVQQPERREKTQSALAVRIAGVHKLKRPRGEWLRRKKSTKSTRQQRTGRHLAESAHFFNPAMRELIFMNTVSGKPVQVAAPIEYIEKQLKSISQIVCHSWVHCNGHKRRLPIGHHHSTRHQTIKLAQATYRENSFAPTSTGFSRKNALLLIVWFKCRLRSVSMPLQAKMVFARVVFHPTAGRPTKQRLNWCFHWRAPFAHWLPGLSISVWKSESVCILLHSRWNVFIIAVASSVCLCLRSNTWASQCWSVFKVFKTAMKATKQNPTSIAS